MIQYGGKPLSFSSFLPGSSLSVSPSGPLPVSSIPDVVSADSSSYLSASPLTTPSLAKYWTQRYRLYSKFDAGVQLDEGELLCGVHLHVARHKLKILQFVLSGSCVTLNFLMAA